MGDKGFNVVPADMTHDQGQWTAASEALGRAATSVEHVGEVAFGSFATHVKDTYDSATTAVSSNLTSGKTALAAMATNLANNSGQYGTDDKDSDGKVRGAGAGAGSGGGNGQDASDHGGKGKDHYAELMSTATPMPADPKDPEITFDRSVDPETGEVSWTPREMKPGESVAVDGRDVERIPQRADRIVVTMVDGEPQITYVDNDAVPADKGPDRGVQWQAETAAKTPDVRVVAGSGAVEPSAPLQQQPADEWSRPLPDGADYAVAEVRDGEVHLTFLDVKGDEVSVSGDVRLGDAPIEHAPPPAPAPSLSSIPTSIPTSTPVTEA